MRLSRLDIAPTPPSIELRQLRYYLAVVEELHFGRAAERLQMTEPQLSQAVQKLEDEIGVRLLEHGRRSVTPTDAGRAFTDSARRVLATLDLSVAETRRAGGLGETLRIGCVPDLPLQHLQAFLGALYQRDAALRVDVTHLRSVDQLDRLQFGELDLAVIEYARQDDGFEMEPLFPGEPLAAFLPLGHRLAAKRALGPDDLREEVLLVFPRASDPTLHDQFIEILGGAGYRFGRVREASGAHARDVLVAVAQRGGITIGRSSTLRALGDAEAVVSGRPLDPAPQMPDTMLAWRANPPRRLDGMVAAARQIAGELRRWDG